MTTPSATPRPAPPADPAHARRVQTGRWLAVLGLAAGGVLGGTWLIGGGEDPREARARPLVLSAADVALASGAPEAAFRRTNPPVDIRLAERTAQGVTLGQIQPPDARHLAAYRRADIGEDLVSAALVYDDPARAAALDDAAAPLLGSNFGFRSTPITLAGTTDARLWSSGAYRAISFRQAGVVTFVGTNRIDDEAYVRRLAEAARDRVAAHVAASTPPNAAP